MKKDINSELKKAEKLNLPDSLSDESIKARLKEEKPLSVKKNTAAVVRRAVAVAAVFALVLTTLVIAKPWDGHVKVPAGELTGSVDVPGSDSYESIEKLFVTYYKANRLTFSERLSNRFQLFSDDVKYAASAEGAIVGGGANANGSAAPESGMAVADSGTGIVTSPAYGKTNEQVAGVSESDIIKNDGKYLYVVRNNCDYYGKYAYYGGAVVSYGSEGGAPAASDDTGRAGVFIIEPKENGEMEIIGKISVDPGENTNGYVQLSNIYVVGDTLIAVGCSSQAVIYEANTLAVFYNIADRTAPKEISRFYQSGNEISTRLTGGRLYIITNHFVRMTDTETEMKESCIPMTGTSAGSMARVPSQNICVMENLSSPSYLVVTSLDIASPEAEPASAAVLGGGEHIYCNTERLYVMNAEYDYGFVSTMTGSILTYAVEENGEDLAVSATAAAPAAAPADAEDTTENTVVTPVTDEAASETTESETTEAESEAETAPEPTTAAMPATEGESETEAKEKKDEFTFGDGSKTTIYSFDITNGGVKYLANGSVPGTPLNQFSADEYDGYFRIATTTDSFAGNSGVNIVSVLNSKLETVGSLSNLGAGETIQSVRFMGTRGYVVTFLQTDPLFVIDLTTPTAPVLLGELKLPGFSAYLHPVSSTLLIGIGQDGDDNGTNGGLKVSLFDVSDPSKPTEADKYVINSGAGYVRSDAYNDAKAICWDSENAVFYFPYVAENFYSYSSSEWMAKTRIAALKVDAAGKRFGTKTEYIPESQSNRGWVDAFNRVTYIGNSVFAFANDRAVSFDKSTAQQLDSLDLSLTKIGDYTGK